MGKGSLVALSSAEAFPTLFLGGCDALTSLFTEDPLPRLLGRRGSTGFLLFFRWSSGGRRFRGCGSGFPAAEDGSYLPDLFFYALLLQLQTFKSRFVQCDVVNEQGCFSHTLVTRVGL
jgi:hypothetical protein